MRVVTTDGTELECGGFEAVDGGVVLYAEQGCETKRGFLPAGQVRYVLDDDLAATVEGETRPREKEYVLPDERPVRSEDPIDVAEVDGA